MCILLKNINDQFTSTRKTFILASRSQQNKCFHCSFLGFFIQIYKFVYLLFGQENSQNTINSYLYSISSKGGTLTPFGGWSSENLPIFKSIVWVIQMLPFQKRKYLNPKAGRSQHAVRSADVLPDYTLYFGQTLYVNIASVEVYTSALEKDVASVQTIASPIQVLDFSLFTFFVLIHSASFWLQNIVLSPQ